MVMRNSKFEIQNSKQIRNSNCGAGDDMSSCPRRNFSFSNWIFEFVSNFEFRISNLVSLLLLFVAVLDVAAQSPSIPPQQDPLMSLMLSQPRIDITTNVTAAAYFDPP